ncbi:MULTISPECIES: DUF3147 family protein [Microbispora]|uniref:DUF3147 family protein n=2 Tax=Microbispora TaxID=2005 RepID=A0A5N6BU87_9ACTN|nr:MULTISPECIES: DUF3147 family protein [Microbispora]KAB8184001.1 DUF3147 family protein [Microbispora catharanthi]GLX11075.1 hypothetical protein Misp03_80010 [Microbispora sp. NBRC 16548]
MSARRDDGPAPDGGRVPDDGRKVRLRLSELRRPPMRDWAVRFAFGAGVSALAGMVSVLAGPRAGGLFLAFPAILLASVTLVAKEEGVRQAGQDVAGATFGTVGLIGFAVVVALTVTDWPLWLSLAIATLTWAALSLALYAAVARLRL